MFIELTEVLVCPACRAGREGDPGSGREGDPGSVPQGLVARVDRLEGRRVIEGSLGCPRCEVRYPIRQGVVLFSASAPEGPRGSVDPDEAALLLPALLGLEQDATGYVLLGPGLAGAAGRIAGVASAVEVVVLADPDPGAGAETAGADAEPAVEASVEPAAAGEPPADPPRGDRRVSLLSVADVGDLPLFSGRFRGVGLVGGDGSYVREAARILASRGRLAILSPTAEALDAVEDAGLETLAAEDRALVASRP